MKKKKVWLFSGAGVIVLAVVLIIFLNGRVASVGGDGMEEDMGVLVQKVTEEELAETILVTGEVVPEGEQKIFLDPENGDITDFKVEENQKVSAGDTLFAYDTSKIDVEFGSAVRERDLVQIRLKTEQNQIAEMDKQIAAMKKNVGKQPTKKEDDESDADMMDEQVTQADVNQLVNERAQLEIEIEGTKAEITGAQEQINEIDTRKKEMTVVSKLDGVVVKVNKSVEKTETGSSEPVIHIISSEPFKVIGTMSEFDAVKIQPEQKVIIRPKVYKEKEWNGVVESVSQFPNDGSTDGEFSEDFSGGGGNVTMYPFKVAITDDTTELRQGFHVSLEVKLDGSGKSLVVPHMAVIDEEEGTSIVYVMVDNVLERREVQTGEMNDEFIGITDGVELDELVVITPDEEMYDGMEVTSFDEVE